MTATRTVARDIRLEGVGIHSGWPCVATIHPRDSESGIAFMHDNITIPAIIDNARESSRYTTLAANGAELHTVEHILSALFGMGVTNALVELSAPEPPILDGSALPIAQAIADAGVVETGAAIEPFIVKNGCFIHEGKKAMFAYPTEGFKIGFCIDHEHPMMDSQWRDFTVTPETYLAEIAPARTYGFEEEIKQLFESGLALGGSLDNALIVYSDHYSSPLRFPDEPVRHKMIDLIGDLALIGRPIRGHVVGVLSGHAMHARFVRRMIESEK